MALFLTMCFILRIHVLLLRAILLRQSDPQDCLHQQACARLELMIGLPVAWSSRRKALPKIRVVTMNRESNNEQTTARQTLGSQRIIPNVFRIH